MVICNPVMIGLMKETAKNLNVPYQLEILEGGGTDTCSMQLSGADVMATCVSIPTRYIHSINETMSKKDYDLLNLYSSSRRLGYSS